MTNNLVQGSIVLVEKVGALTLDLIDTTKRAETAEHKASDLALKLGQAEQKIKDLENQVFELKANLGESEISVEES